MLHMQFERTITATESLIAERVHKIKVVQVHKAKLFHDPTHVSCSEHLSRSIHSRSNYSASRRGCKWVVGVSTSATNVISRVVRRIER